MTATAASRRALHDLIDLDRVIHRTAEFVQIPSLNPFAESELGPQDGERAAAAWLQAQMQDLGYETGSHEVAPDRPNLWGISPGGEGPIVALGGHLDTVGVEGYDGDPFSGRIADGRISGRGSCDMKGAFACFLEVAEVLRAADVELHGRLMIAGLADEEAAMLGSKQFPDHAPQPDMAILGEPTELAICVSHMGQYAFPIRTYGRAVHSSIANQGVNAIEKMMAVIASLHDYREELANRPPHPLCGVGRVNAGVIHGGNMVSIVPDWCELHVDRRLLPGETAARAKREVTELLDALAAADPDFTYTLEDPMTDAPPLDTPTGAAVVQAARHAARASRTDDSPVAFPASTDGPNLGVPSIVWGPGALAQAHTVDEWVAIDQLETATHLYLDTVLELIAR